MMVKALIVEQLESDGTLRSFQMEPSTSDSIVVAFADEYNEPRAGPFHFHSEDDERRFRDGFAGCRARRLGQPNFRRDRATFHMKAGWSGIPTERNSLSYYALSLPEFAIPQRLSVTDPHQPGREYRRNVARDDDRHRYVIYLECTSKIGRFDFDLMCDFVIDRDGFATSSYRDPKSSDADYHRGDDWKHFVSEPDRRRIQQFFIGEVRMSGDHYSAGQAGAMGPTTQSAAKTRVHPTIWVAAITVIGTVTVALVQGWFRPWETPPRDATPLMGQVVFRATFTGVDVIANPRTEAVSGNFRVVPVINSVRRPDFARWCKVRIEGSRVTPQGTLPVVTAQGGRTDVFAVVIESESDGYSVPSPNYQDIGVTGEQRPSTGGFEPLKAQSDIQTELRASSDAGRWPTLAIRFAIDWPKQ